MNWGDPDPGNKMENFLPWKDYILLWPLLRSKLCEVDGLARQPLSESIFKRFNLK
jgi:hypothetical protein